VQPNLNDKPVLIPTILCGGSGTRLWPVSRQKHPKPFMQLPNGFSMLQNTFLRAAELSNCQHILTILNRDCYFKAKDEYTVLAKDTIKQTFIVEPFPKNTAAAIAIGALNIAADYGNEAIMLVLPADHLIEDGAAFSKVIDDAVQLAQQGQIITIGVKPTYPETGFGYIECGAPLTTQQGYKVACFTEKPDVTKAQQFIDLGNYLWNAGIFCFKVGVILDYFKKLTPQLLTHAQTCYAKSVGEAVSTPSPLELSPAFFEQFEDVSFDYAIMEKADKVAVVPATFNWHDLGSWLAVAKLTPADENGNRVRGETVLIDTKNSYIQSDSRLVAALGVEDLIVIDTADALMITHRDKVQDVKKFVQHLSKQQHSSVDLHQTVHRPWGSYTILEESNHFKIKRIVVNPKQSLSLQVHKHRSEHWVIVSGIAEVVNGDDTLVLKADESTFIPAGHQHRLTNHQDVALILIEVQTGGYLGEDDIVRLEDVYGRTLDAAAKANARVHNCNLLIKKD